MRKFLIVGFAVALFIPAICITYAFGVDHPPINPELRQRVAKRYPNQKIVNWCSGKFAGKDASSLVVLHNEAKKQFSIVWLMTGAIQELDTVPQTDSNSDFELQCMDAREAQELQDTLQNSEGISSSVAIPKGEGAVCYFIDNTTANCWSVDRATGKLVRVGAWET